MNLIDVEDLSFAYGGSPIISGATLGVRKGEILGLIGPNGGGKTTFVRLMLGLLRPASGKIRRSYKRPGFVPQWAPLEQAFPISCREVVLMGDLSSLNFWGGYTNKARERAACLMEDVGLGDMKQRPFSDLSGGERQRLLFARALMGDPDILFLDEPTASCDAHSQEVIFNLIGAMRGKKTVVTVTHDLGRAFEFFDRTAVINRTLEIFEKGAVCEHFALGLYHTPLGQSSCFQRRKKK